jgi:hypothetical protein
MAVDRQTSQCGYRSIRKGSACIAEDPLDLIDCGWADLAPAAANLNDLTIDAGPLFTGKEGKNVNRSISGYSRIQNTVQIAPVSTSHFTGVIFPAKPRFSASWASSSSLFSLLPRQ